MYNTGACIMPIGSLGLIDDVGMNEMRMVPSARCLYRSLGKKDLYAIWIGSKPKFVNDFTGIDSIGQKVALYIHSQRENLMKKLHRLEKLEERRGKPLETKETPSNVYEVSKEKGERTGSCPIGGGSDIRHPYSDEGSHVERSDNGTQDSQGPETQEIDLCETQEIDLCETQEIDLCETQEMLESDLKSDVAEIDPRSMSTSPEVDPNRKYWSDTFREKQQELIRNSKSSKASLCTEVAKAGTPSVAKEGPPEMKGKKVDPP